MPKPWDLVAAAWGSVAGLMAVILVETLVLLTRTGLSPSWLPSLDWFSALGTGWLVGLGILLAVALVMLRFWIWIHTDWRRYRWMQSQEDRLGLSRAEHETEQAEARLQTYLKDEVVLPFLREEIRSLEPPDERTDIRRLDRAGLVEVHDLQFQVSTPAHEHLARLIAETRSGTIGVSGSRGAGKTSLLRYFCRPDLPDTPLEEKRVRVFVSAPVEYAARDFVLHVFSELCYGVCEILGIERSAFRSPSPEASRPYANDPWRLARRPMIIRFARSLLIGGALFLLSLSASGLVFELSQGPQTARGLEETGESVEETSENRPDDGKATAANVGTSPVEVDRRQPNSIRSFVRDNKKPLFDYALGLMFLAALVHFGLPYLFSKPNQISDLGPRWSRPPFPLDRPDSTGTTPWKETYRLALDHLENIHFQQSFSSGWKGSLSMPLLNVDHSLSQSLSARQQSLPDIMASFRSFIEILPTRQPVIISIDELDKMASPDKAESFLNDIKSIFGIPRCVYIISVSLQAMSRFHRRGLPFRDTFDSAFDEVVHARYFDLEHSTRLLNRRVIGLPPAFHALCHLLAGGLPRDLIRSCRSLLTIRDAIAEDADEPVLLDRLCDAMIQEEVRSKLDALEVEYLSPGRQERPALLIEGLRDVVEGRRLLREVASELRAAASTERQKEIMEVGEAGRHKEAPGLDVAAAAGELSMENAATLPGALAAYLWYLATVQQVMARANDSGASPPRVDVDRLAGLRPEIGADPEAAWQRIETLRQQLDLDMESTCRVRRPKSRARKAPSRRT